MIGNVGTELTLLALRLVSYHASDESAGLRSSDIHNLVKVPVVVHMLDILNFNDISVTQVSCVRQTNSKHAPYLDPEPKLGNLYAIIECIILVPSLRRLVVYHWRLNLIYTHRIPRPPRIYKP